jgi:hypothetical protein
LRGEESKGWWRRLQQLWDEVKLWMMLVEAEELKLVGRSRRPRSEWGGSPYTVSGLIVL